MEWPAYHSTRHGGAWRHRAAAEFLALWFGHENEPYRVDCMCSPTNTQTACIQAMAVDHTQIGVATVHRLKIKTTRFVLSTVIFIFNIHADLTTYSHTVSFFSQSDHELHEEMK